MSENNEISARPPDHSDLRNVVEPADALRHQIAHRLVGGKARAQELLRPRLIAEQRLNLGDVTGDIIDERRQLPAEDRRDCQDHQHESQNGDGDNRQGGNGPVDAGTLDAIDQRIEQIGDGHAGHEGQQDAAQKP